MMSMAARGRVARPALKGANPSTNCRYWVSTKNRPNMQKKVRVMVAAPTLNRRLRKRPIGSIGAVLRRSHCTKATANTANDTNPAIVEFDPQPFTGASMMA
jgi:hypothetical protein